MPGEGWPRCAIEGCTGKGEPDPEVPCAYFCVSHASFTLERRIAEFQRVVREREERDAES